MDARLRVVRGPLSGDTIRVPRGKLLIGRETDCHLRLDSKSVSAHHCVLLLDEYTLRIRDLGSTNGTFLNGNRIGKHESILLHDDTVSIDELTFQIDLSQPADREAATAEETPPAVSPNALDATGILDGDTDPVVPTDVVEPSPSEPRSEDAADESSAAEGETSADARMSLQSASTVSEGRRATATLSAVASPPVAFRKGAPKTVAEPAVTLTTPSKPLAVNPKQSAKPKPRAAAKIERNPKRSKSISKKSALMIAGSIGLIGLVGGGVILLRSGQAAKFEAPQKYVQFSPKSFETILTCEVPEDWKQKFRGGRNAGPVWAQFSDGRLTIEICENLSGDGIREAVVAMRKKADPARRDAPPAEQIHESQRQKSSDNFKSYNEAPRSRGLETKGYGEARVSDFTATEGLLGTEVSGCRATVLTQAHQLTVTCKCPPSLIQDAKPVFEKVISSLGFGAVTEAK
jgi:pSer/pThr/pTyr-binding forkhead associated (FHA) protein